ncbi:MAG: ATP synthase F0 subunit B [Desulfomonile tiedjei]|nr:ATP synthase F0 subunit B [Desulfomonile tiedjei]
MKARLTLSLFLVLPLILICASSALAASEAGSSPWTMSMLLWRVVNTVALLALLIYFLKKPLVNFFKERKAKIEQDLAEAVEQRRKAEELIKEYQMKLAGMEQELEKMRGELQKAAEGESQKVIASADKMSVAIIESAKIAAEQEVRKAKVALKDEAVTLAVELAESLIREKISDDDRKKIVEDYLVKVGGMK